MLEERPARVGQGDDPGRAVEQRGADAALELTELRAQGLLRDVESVGGAGEVQLPREDLERVQVTQLHIHKFGL